MERKEDGEKLLKNIQAACSVFGGTVVGIWAFAANRFRYDELILLVAAGVLAGACIGVVCSSLLRYRKN